jgi:uncharacterized beta-barrel protein YwiB (DUF1934 family)
MGLFGGGNSSSSTSNETQNIDQKIQTAAGSTGVSASGNSVVTMLDGGAVGKAFDFAANIAQGAAQEATASSASIQSMATSAMQSVQSAYKDTTGTVAAAYETAKAGEQKIMVAVAMSILAIVAIKVMGKSA